MFQRNRRGRVELYDLKAEGGPALVEVNPCSAREIMKHPIGSERYVSAEKYAEMKEEARIAEKAAELVRQQQAQGGGDEIPDDVRDTLTEAVTAIKENPKDGELTAKGAVTKAALVQYLDRDVTAKELAFAQGL